MSPGAARYLDRLTADPEIMVGKPVVRGTRVPVEQVLEHLATNMDVLDLLNAYPRLTVDDVRACLEYARLVVQGKSITLPQQLADAVPGR